MSSEQLAIVSGAVLSLAFSYIPGLRNWFDNLEGDYKRLFMLGALLLSAAGVFGFACLGRYGGVACNIDGVWALVEAFVLAAIANQTAYQLTPKGK